MVVLAVVLMLVEVVGILAVVVLEDIGHHGTLKLLVVVGLLKRLLPKLLVMLN